MKRILKSFAFLAVFQLSITSYSSASYPDSPDQAFSAGNIEFGKWLEGDKLAPQRAQKYYAAAWEKFKYDTGIQRNYYLVLYALAANSWNEWSAYLTDLYAQLDPWVKRQVKPPDVLKLHIDLWNEAIDDDSELYERIAATIKANPRSSAAWNFMADYHEFEKNYDLAIEAAKRSKALHPGSSDIDYRIGNLFYKKWAAQECSLGGDHLAMESMKYILEASGKNKNNQLLLNRLNFSYKFMGLFPLAIDFGKKAVAIEEDEYSLRDLAHAYFMYGKFEEAEPLYAKLAKKYNEGYYYQLAMLAMAEGNYKKYKRYYKKASRNLYMSYSSSLMHIRMMEEFEPKKAREELEVFKLFAPYAKGREPRWNKITFNYLVNDFADEKYFGAAQNVCDLAKAKFYKGIKLWAQDEPEKSWCEISKSMSYGVLIGNEYLWAKVLTQGNLLGSPDIDCGANEIVEKAINNDVFPDTVEEYLWALENSTNRIISIEQKVAKSPEPNYPDWASFDRVEGQVILDISINEAGVIDSVGLVEESPQYYSFGESAIKSAWKRRYYPKVERGIPVPVENFRVKYTFRIPSQADNSNENKPGSTESFKPAVVDREGSGQKTNFRAATHRKGNYQILKVASPHYEEHLKKAGVEGWVVVQFSLNELGYVEDATVVDESPKGVFTSEAITSVKNSTYKPAMKDGVPVRTEGILTRVRFTLKKKSN